MRVQSAGLRIGRSCCYSGAGGCGCVRNGSRLLTKIGTAVGTNGLHVPRTERGGEALDHA